MSDLSDIEAAILARLAALTHAGQPLFRSVRATSGPLRSAQRELLLRERPPAAHVAFVDDAFAAAATRLRGPRFAIWVATRSLRAGGNPRDDEPEGAGTHAVLALVRAGLERLAVLPGRRAIGQFARALESDGRTAICELQYRVEWPPGPVVFNGAALGGSLSITTRGPRPPFVEFPAEPPADILRWEGELRATSASGLSAIESGLDNLAAQQPVGDLTDPGGPVYLGMRFYEWTRRRPRWFDPDLGLYVQSAAAMFQKA